MKKYHFSFGSHNGISSVDAETLLGALGWIQENTDSKIDDIKTMEVL
tara:strand:- start:25771 stop:25911 length:141 start_codon:yes stop_codon:yes gene_type:complete